MAGRARAWAGVLFDIDGVLLQGQQAIPGAVDAVAWVQQRGIPHRFVTNNSSLPCSAIVKRLGDAGIKITLEDVLTPVTALATRFKAAETTPNAALFVPQAATTDLVGVCNAMPADAESGADAVVLGDLADQWTFSELNRAFRLLMDNPKADLIALGFSKYWKVDGKLQLDVAPFAVALQHATDRTPLVYGKPSREFFHAALASMHIPVSNASKVLMIGDDIIGDVQGAQQAGLAGALVRTGKFTPQDLEKGVKPDHIFDSVGSLIPLLVSDA